MKNLLRTITICLWAVILGGTWGIQLALAQAGETVVGIGDPYMLTSDSFRQYLPVVSGDRAIWLDSRDYTNNNRLEIYTYDFLTGVETRLNPGSLVPSYGGLDFEGDRIIYSKGNPLFMYDLATDEEILLVDEGAYASISGDLVAYSALGIFVLDLNTGVSTQLAVAPGWGMLIDPDISGNSVVWDDYNGGVHFYDLSTGETRQLSVGDASEPAISGDLVVYFGLGESGDRGIQLYDLSTGVETTLTNNITARRPDISGSIVVWDAYVDGNYTNRDIYLYDLSTHTEYQVTFDTSDQLYASISGNRIVWDKGQDIQAVEFETATFEELMFSLAQCLQDLEDSQAELLQCELDLNQTLQDLSEITADLAAVTTQLAEVTAELEVATADTDADGVRDTADQCPGTVSGAEIDLLGCSIAQFCGAIDASGKGRAICSNSDWKNDEPNVEPQDCKANKGVCLPF